MPSDDAPRQLELGFPVGGESPVAPLHPVVAEEEAVLERVGARLDAPAPRERRPEETVARDLERLREVMQEHEKTEDAPAILEQWNRQSALLQQLRAARAAPAVARDSPYFAHLRFREDGRDHDILLGKATDLRGDLPIVDWRHAPVARLFYRYRQGDDYDEEISGRERVGRIEARRTVTIRERRLERVEAPEGVFQRRGAEGGWRRLDPAGQRLGGGERAALRAYAIEEGGARRLGTDPGGRARTPDKHLPDIAGLIDPAQFELIARPDSGFVVIRGVAGSGKTTVALHRIAWLAYQRPLVDSAQTLVVVFSPALRDYVSHVLPALGVERVRVRTFPDWAAETTRRVLPALPRERRDDAPALVQRLKGHPALMTALERHVRSHPGPATPALVIDDWGSVLGQAGRLEALFAELAPDAFRGDGLHEAAAWCRRQHDAVVAFFEGDRTAEAELHPEDDPLLLRAWQLRVGPLPTRLRHVAIDEVQDFSPIEVRVLIDCLDERQSLTLAGDTQQHVMEEAGFTSWTEFLAHLGLVGTEISTLETSYRCTREIATFAADLLGPLREDTPKTTREGPPVELFRFTDMGACVAFLADALRDLVRREPFASIAVLTPSPAVSAAVDEGLRSAEVPRLRRVVDWDFEFAPGVQVAEIEQAKGLEFDYVVLVEASASWFPDRPAARRLLHVGATRAIHQLWLTSVGTPSPLIRASGP